MTDHAAPPPQHDVPDHDAPQHDALQHDDPDLDALGGELRRVVALADPVPDAWRSAATASFAWAALPGETAHLVYDSRADLAGRPGGPHGPDGSQPVVRYSTGSTTIEVELDAGADKVRLVGRVIPGRAATLVVSWPGGHRAVDVDDGAFHVDELPRRPLCLQATGDQPVKSGWIVP